jgi:DNA replication protein DnaC
VTHSQSCILSSRCKLADTGACNKTCQHYVATMGMTGKSGRAGLANVPADYRLTTVINSPVRVAQERAYKLIDAYTATFERQFDDISDTGGKDTHKRIKSLYLFSESPGTGKTTSASAILNEWLIVNYIGSLKRNRQPLQLPAYFLDVNEWQTLFNEFNRSNIPKDVAEPASREYYRRMHLAKVTPFVVCDDIGLRTATEAFRADLHSVINHRTTNRLPTVFTSNLPIEEMAQVFDARLYDRMRDMCAVIEFEGTSARGMRK